MRSAKQRYRTRISIAFGIVVFAVAAVSESRWESQSEMVTAVLMWCGLLLVGVASLGRLWCSVYIAGHKTKRLIVDGPYSISRNPLYFFSLIGVIGAGLCSETMTLPAILAAVFVVSYPMIIRDEEQVLLSVHGEAFETYKQNTPRFWPRLSSLREPETYEVNPIIFRKHLFDAMIFVWCAGLLEVLEQMRELGWLPTLLRVY